MGAWQVTLTAGEGIDRLNEIESACRYFGFKSWFRYLYEMCRLTLEARGQQPLMPVLDVGAVPIVELRRLAPVVPLMRLLLDTVDPDLAATVHGKAPQKSSLLRSLALQDTGRAGVPVTTGIRVGIGESQESWEEAVEIANSVHEKYGNVMSFHLVPFVPLKFSKMEHHPPVSNEVYQDAVRVVRKGLNPSITLVAEVYHRLGLAAEAVVAGAFDFGHIRIADSERFDLDMLNQVQAVRELLEKLNVGMECSTVLRDSFLKDRNLPPRVLENLERFWHMKQGLAVGQPNGVADHGSRDSCPGAFCDMPVTVSR